MLLSQVWRRNICPKWFDQREGHTIKEKMINHFTTVWQKRTCGRGHPSTALFYKILECLGSFENINFTEKALAK